MTGGLCAPLRGDLTGVSVDLPLDVQGWEARAACRGMPLEVFFHDDGVQADYDDAKAVCGRCVVRRECLELALRAGFTTGVFGGLTARERQRMRAEDHAA